MTICLAAIATENNMEHIVFATDHMVTTPVGSFEHPSVKYKIINDKTIAMLAGNPIIFNDLVDFTDTDILFEDMKGNIFDNYGYFGKKKRRR
ncbi:hypothetical protein MBGDF03_01155 [Thermoplasmatales archaeon SCGC AB-540-F20]|nr:hypothetical protein MBGDF03_01155 [Thermoplasmatales archaeon SCGC AB-540-F20]